MRILSIISFFAITILLSACSWNEYFIVVNRSDSDILIDYELDESLDPLDIFRAVPEVYKADDNDEIDWENGIIDTEDIDIEPEKVRLNLKQGMILKFGFLSNDYYESSDQEFINNTDFNLTKLKIKSPKDSIMIDKDNFDEYFNKEKGYIKMILK